jgi:hypothetical protein
MTRMYVVLCALMLAGCGAAKIDSPANARAEYQKSIDDEYRACINDNLKNVEKCEGKRVQIEANERAYNNMTAGITQGGNIANRITAGVTQGASAANTPQTTSSLPARIPPAPPEIADSEPPDARSIPTPTPF